MIDTTETLQEIVEKGASDIFIVAGRSLTYKANGTLKSLNEIRLMPDDTRDYVEAIYRLASDRPMDRLFDRGDDDFSFALPGVSRFRVSAYRQRGSLSAVIRVITFELPMPQLLGIPEEVLSLAELSAGLVLVTGASGCGKSTTLACLIDYINSNRAAHIITLEDPIEFLHPHKMSIVSQREIVTDTTSYLTALRSALRQSPDVILLGSFEDVSVISLAMNAAESGRLVLAPMHTHGVANTVRRVIGSFPAEQQNQTASELADILQAVVTERLVLSGDGRLVPEFDVQRVTGEIRDLIREGRLGDL